MNFKEPLTEIKKDGVNWYVYQLGGPSRTALYGCSTAREAEAFVAGLRANDGGAYAQGYALGRHEEYGRWVEMLNRFCMQKPFEHEP